MPFSTLLLPELRSLNPSAGRDAFGLSRAFVPGRNALFLARAAAALAEPGEPLRLVLGANLDDAIGFPDCRPQFFDGFGPALAGRIHWLHGGAHRNPMAVDVENGDPSVVLFAPGGA